MSPWKILSKEGLSKGINTYRNSIQILGSQKTQISEDFGCCCGCKCICTDLMMVFDTTGSMGGFIQNLKSVFFGVVESFNSSTCRWALTDYKDYEDRGPYEEGYSNKITFTNDIARVQSQIERLDARGGGDGPEQNLSALKWMADKWFTLGGRPDDTECYNEEENIKQKVKKAICWAGDVDGWEDGAKGNPYPTLQATIDALVRENIKVFALGTGLDGNRAKHGNKQATEITKATGGVYIPTTSFTEEEIVRLLCSALNSD